MLFCGEASAAAGAFALITKVALDLVIVDPSECLRGAKVIRAFRFTFVSVPALVLSHQEEKSDAAPAIHAGAHGFVNKSESKETVVADVRRPLAGGIHLSAAAAHAILHVAQTEVTAMEAQAVLSPCERLLFEMLGTGYKPAEIARRMTMGVRT